MITSNKIYEIEQENENLVFFALKVIFQKIVHLKCEIFFLNTLDVHSSSNVNRKRVPIKHARIINGLCQFQHMTMEKKSLKSISTFS